ncbi:hypothetical protein K9B32_27770 [Rhizobium sp. 3T7]|uniref:gluconokinase n=1 Tax=Rhizobium sp. 3T7 TaxID=2874922 RepID=UPI001CCF7303|nr:gluconokinase, GntK/IdnK-type [Rhizobium sp. 3T7]MBZ9793854.1 hypothetical protein [Rhizobium sp. 3T7]
MGVAGSGKSAVGVALAARLSATYLDGDDLHPSENIAKMSRGEPLTDEDREPWLTLVGQRFAAPDGILIVGCSALKRRYRDHIRAQAHGRVIFIHLAGTKKLIAARIGRPLRPLHADEPHRQPVRSSRTARSGRKRNHRQHRHWIRTH